jgi:hypothetical protein
MAVGPPCILVASQELQPHPSRKHLIRPRPGIAPFATRDSPFLEFLIKKGSRFVALISSGVDGTVRVVLLVTPAAHSMLVVHERHASLRPRTNSGALRW